MNNNEKNIYNLFLATNKRINNKPFKYRKNFDNFEDEKYVYINRLSSFFKKFNHIKIEDFFEAPYFVYGEKYFDLKFYCTQKAIKTYSLYHDRFLLNNPDSEQTIEKVKSSLIFIQEYCKDKNLKLEDYITFKEQTYNIFLKHLKERRINFFILFCFSFENELKGMDKETRSMFNENLNNINYLRTKLYTSSKCKIIINHIKNKLK
jgi:hypothetical protein|tara:strand:- start:466 stop:1083 length:618 start_codon:yes stop_codon:yes gene_type:complete